MILSHDLEGAGPVVVLLHSGVCDRRMWEPQAAALVAAGHRVLRPDLRGYGRTPAASGPYRDADDVLALLDSLGIREAAFVGASFGGRVALELAAGAPERVRALALLCPARAGFVPGAELTALWEREDALLEAGDVEAAVALNVEHWVGPEATAEARALVAVMQRRAFELQLAALGPDGDPAGEADTEDAGADTEGSGAEGADTEGAVTEGDAPAEDGGPDLATALAPLDAPALVVGGAHDFAEFRAIAAEVAALLPRARHVELDWAGHLPAVERPAETSALLLEFLAAAGTEPAPAA
ncbi:alpha/beta fold hydrolase [Streptomyces sp. NPDC101132]|uniref:alpha/beta fold hydrolase n=1 Tax=Streptomyces sp. NPDC101132 TaxID=3366110 RepID=UPI00380710AF